MSINLPAQRLFNQCISPSSFTHPEEIVSWLGAVQAQDFAAAKWALGLRAPGMTDSIVDEIFNAGKIIRTHILRPTWHFVTPADLRWMLMLTAPRVKMLNATYERKFGLEAATFHQSNAVLERTLQGGKTLTRPQLESALREAGIPTDDLRATLLVMRAELDGVLCSGPRLGKQFTYTLLEERVPPAPQRTREEALAELTLRYFTSHGPATSADFAWWSGLSTADVRAGLETVKTSLEHETMDGKTYWFAKSAQAAKTVIPTALLLPCYDEYIVSYSDRSAISSGVQTDRLDSRGNVLFNNTLILDGQVAGTWQRTLKKNEVAVTLMPFTQLTEAHQQAAAEAAARYGTFLGMTVTLQIIRRED